jgi:hypothetical protein
VAFGVSIAALFFKLIKFVSIRFSKPNSIEVANTQLSRSAPGPFDSSQQTTLGLSFSVFAPTHPISRKAPSKSGFLTWTDQPLKSLRIVRLNACNYMAHRVGKSAPRRKKSSCRFFVHPPQPLNDLGEVHDRDDRKSG